MFRAKSFSARAAGGKMRFTAVAAAVLKDVAATDPVTDTDMNELPRVSSEEEAAVDSILSLMPTLAIDELDAWARKVQSITVDGTFSSNVLSRKLEEARLLVSRWVLLRQTPTELLCSFDAVAGGSVSFETMLMDAFRHDVDTYGYMYLNRVIYRPFENYVCQRGTLESVLYDCLASCALSVQDHFVKSPASLKRVADVLHDSFVRDDRFLKFDSSRIMFENFTAVISSAGVDLVAITPVMTHRPVVPRIYIPTRLTLNDHSNVSWDCSKLFDPALMPMIGAAMRPPFLRHIDVRPLLIIATGASEDQHPLMWILRVFCGNAVTRKMSISDGACALRASDPYVLCVDVINGVLTLDDLLQIKAALSSQMVVVVHSLTVPPLLNLPEEEFLRLCAVHVHMPSAPPQHALEEALVHLLPASQAVYRREAVSHKQLFTFINTSDLLRYRLPDLPSRRSCALLLLEMMQGEAGIQLKPGASCSFASLAAAFDAYRLLRSPDFDAACSVSDVLLAFDSFKIHFGHLRVPREVVFVADTGVFMNLACFQTMKE